MLQSIHCSSHVSYSRVVTHRLHQSNKVNINFLCSYVNKEPEKMDSVLMVLNQNRILWGVSMLLLNIGSRYVVADLGKSHEYILSHHIVKKLIVLSMFFVATRDLLTSFLLTVAYILIIDGILHEKKPFCLLPKKILDEVKSNKVSNDEYFRAKNIISTFEKQNNTETNNDNDTGTKAENNSQVDDKKKEYINYLTNLAMLKYK